MGLDITAYEAVEFDRPLGDEMEDADYDYTVEALLYYGDPSFQAVAGMSEGIYRFSGEKLDFRAGSYSGYNEWRRGLARLVGVTAEDVWREKAVAPAFGEMINFSDCEGFLGTTTCRKLTADFAAWQDRAEAYAGLMDAFNGDYWLSKYQLWRRAFDLASANGVVRFH